MMGTHVIELLQTLNDSKHGIANNDSLKAYLESCCEHGAFISKVRYTTLEVFLIG